MHLTVLVVGQGVLLEPLFDHLVGDGHLVVGRGTDDKLEDVEQFARIATAIAQQRIGLLQMDMALGEFDILGHGTMKKREQIGSLERLEDIELASGEQRADNLERGILGGGTDERHHATLDRPKEAVLLGFGKPVNLVDEEYG